MISLVDAKQHQLVFQQDARALLDFYNIEPLLGPLGEVHTIGSFAYGLMVKPDTDFLIYNERPEFESLLAIANTLMHSPGMGKVSVANHFAWPDMPGVPKSMYLCLKPNWHNVVWQIDIHVMKRQDHQDSDTFAIGWHKKLTEDQRDTILLLKYQLAEQKRYCMDFFSADIYRAVVKDNVRTISELEEWRKTHPFY